jgi:endonuclease-3
MTDKEKRVREIIRLLRKHYPRSRTALEFQSPFEILVATILAAQCTDERVNRVTPGLFRKYPTPADFARAEKSELEQEIRSTGFFRNKAKSIIGASRKIVEDFGGAVPDSMAELVTLPGVARKTANIVLSAGFGRAEGIAVDTHARRLSQRLGLSKQQDPDKIERVLLVDHGRAVCQAKKPNCPGCFLKRLCPSARKFFPGLKPR